MSQLVNILKDQTSSLKTQYVEMTRLWATGYYDSIMLRSTWKESQWCKFLGIPTETKNAGTSVEFEGFPKGFFNTRSARTYDSCKIEIRVLDKVGRLNWIAYRQREAEQHYEDSIIKLADRISKKGMDENLLTVVTSHVGVNIETTLTDGTQTVRAFTIVAAGPVQRPHYRYLIK